MWPNGDIAESEAYQAEGRFVTTAGEAGARGAAHRRRDERSTTMSAPTLDRPPAPGGPAPGGRRSRRPVFLLAAAALVLATAVGTSLAIATRPDGGQAPAADAAAQTPATDQASAPEQRADQPAAREQQATPAPEQPTGGGDDGQPPVLADGRHDAYITKVASDRIVVDVVQVFHDDEAVKAAIADGKPRSDAQYLTTWVRNQNPRLRTLPLADNLVVVFRDSCGEADPGRAAMLAKLAGNAGQKGTFYYTLTVSGGSVQRIQERLAINAC
jgi:hypothetical protein